MPRPARDGGMLKADDPDLLLSWVKAEARPKHNFADPATIPFDRLVSEVAEVDAGTGRDEHNNDTQTGVFPPAAETGDSGPVIPLKGSDAEQVRFLRSQFVQALLLMRRGARSESIALLREMLHTPHTFFDGGAQLFSEFGLGLRRLGLTSLALAAHRRALEFAPRDERILFNIARSYHDLDLLPEARDYLEKALAVVPDFAAAKHFLSFIEGKAAGQTGKP